MKKILCILAAAISIISINFIPSYLEFFSRLTDNFTTGSSVLAVVVVGLTFSIIWFVAGVGIAFVLIAYSFNLDI